MSDLTEPLTKDEVRWIRKVQRVLNECPSARLGFYTIGGPTVSIFDRSREDEIYALMDNGRQCDFGPAVEELKADLGDLEFPNNVHSTAG